MCRFLCVVLLAGVAFICRSQVTWDGEAGDGLWATPANWNRDIVPGVDDDVLLDNSVVAQSFIVFLPGTSVSVRSLRISPSLPDSIQLILPPTNILTSNAFVTTGSGYTIILDANGVFANNSGAASGTNLNIGDSLRINNGGRYIHRMTGGHAGIVQKLARVEGTERGVFEFDVPTASYTVSLTGRIYGSVVFSSAVHAGAVVYSGSGVNPLRIRGDLVISGRSTFSTGLSADAMVKGDCLLTHSTSILNLQNGSNNNIFRLEGHLQSNGTITRSGSGNPQLMFNGSSLQTISVSGVVLNNVTITINNPAGVKLLSAVTLPYRLVLMNGKIYTSPDNLLTLSDNCTSAAASTSSFVDGPLCKIGDDPFEFPIGAGNVYAPLSIANISGENAGDAFIALYHRSNPQTTPGYGPTVGPGLDHASYVEYWKLTQTSGAATKKVSITVGALSFCNDIATTFVGRWNGSAWLNEGAILSNFNSDPPYQTGVLTSQNDISDLAEGRDAFTLVTTAPHIANSLPVEITSFTAGLLANGNVGVSWEISAGTDAEQFIVERKSAGQEFREVGRMQSLKHIRSYQWIDRSPNAEKIAYRLKLVSAGGDQRYSPVRMIVRSPRTGIVHLRVSYQQDAVLRLQFDCEKAGLGQLAVLDIAGKLLINKIVSLVTGPNSIRLPAFMPAPGVYLLMVRNDSGGLTATQFLVQ